MGLDVYLGSKAERKQQDAPSERYPDHLFNRRYLRSSYNGGGFNSAVPDFLGTKECDLYWIFAPMGREWDGDEGTLVADDVPKLRECKTRALDVAERLRKVDPLRVDDIGNFLIAPSMKAGDFLAWFRAEQAKRAEGKGSSFESYSCREGTVFGFDKGLEVLAITVGRGTFDEPCSADHLPQRGDRQLRRVGRDHCRVLRRGDLPDRARGVRLSELERLTRLPPPLPNQGVRP